MSTEAIIARPCLQRQQGVSLIELVVFIVIVGVGLAGILNVLNFTLRNSADPMIRKQQVAIAESLLEEITSKPFTWCDPDDANVTTAASLATCANPEGIGPQAGESRYSTTEPFDNVGDYHGFSMTGIRSPTDASVTLTGLASYDASVTVARVGSVFGLADNTGALRVDVTVTAPSLPALTLTGYRFRYAPQSP